MIGSSAVMTNAFHNLRLSGIDLLIEILTSSQVSNVRHLERVYSEGAEGFEEAVAFLSRIRIVKKSDGKLRIRPNLQFDETSSRAKMLELLMRSRNRYRSEVLRFLRKFQVVETDVVYFSSAEGRSSESAVRNFLIEMGIVKHVIGEARYVLEPEYVVLYAGARDKAKQFPPRALTNRLVAKSDLGLSAELEILSYEKNRLGKSFASKIRHVSQQNTAAGFDIRSVTLQPDGEILPRFIEVKAVPGRSYRFYWSRNEVDVACALAHWYHLYLLPVDKNGRFDLDRLKIISNPYNDLVEDGTGWICETDVLACFLAEDASPTN